MPEPREEKHPEVQSTKDYYLQVLDELCQSIPGVARRKEMLLLIPGLIDKVEEGLVLDAVVQGLGTVNTITDVGSDSIAFVYNSGWALGFEGDGGELVILIDSIREIRSYRTGLYVDMETGESVTLRFLGRTAPADAQGGTQP